MGIKQIYGWMGDTRSNFRRDFRLAGVRDNENGAFLFPDFPELPEGYPDVNPACPGNPDDCQSTAFERVPDREQDFKMHFAPIDCENDPYVDELACEYFKNITGESFDAEKQPFDDKAFIRCQCSIPKTPSTFKSNQISGAASWHIKSVRKCGGSSFTRRPMPFVVSSFKSHFKDPMICRVSSSRPKSKSYRRNARLHRATMKNVKALLFE